MNIVFMGYMGSGKSLVSKELSVVLGRGYIDLDAYIEEQEKKSIKRIFEEKGEIYFRKKETIYLKQVLENNTETIIALGGGTPCFSGNIELMKNAIQTKSVYLQTSLDVLVERLFIEKDKRPLIAHIDTKIDLKDFIRKHLFERSFYYNQASFIVSTDNKSVSEITKNVKGLLF